MPTYTMPSIPSNPDDRTDMWAVDQMAVIRNLRSTRNYNFPRFVRALNNAGYEITVEEYKDAERKPALSIPHIYGGLLNAAYTVLNQTRVRGSQQTPRTEHAMLVLRHARTAMGYDYTDMATALTGSGIVTSAAEYRTAETGITKNVSYDMVITAAEILSLNPAELQYNG